MLKAVCFTLLLWAGTVRQGVMTEKTAAVFGAGPAGLTAAMELAEAGFKVDLFERESRFGGKMVGYMTKRRLATEHATRIYAFKYYALGDVLKRAGLQPPTKDQPLSPNWRELEDQVIGTQSGLVEGNGENLLAKMIELGIAPPEISYFVFQVRAFRQLSLTQRNDLYTTSFGAFIDGFAFDNWQSLTSCTNDMRDVYCNAAHTEAFHSFLDGMLGIFTAAKPTIPAPIGIFIFDIMFRSSLPGPSETCAPYFKYFFSRYAATGPTSYTVLDPWVKHLESLGVNLHSRTSLVSIAIDEQEKLIKSATIKNLSKKEKHVISADIYVMALPVDDAEDILPGVTQERGKTTFWSYSFQFFLPCLSEQYFNLYFNKTVFTLMFDSPYYLVYQLQSPDDGAWQGAKITLKKKYDYVLTVTSSNVTKPGFNGKTFLESTRDEALKEILDQMVFPNEVECNRKKNGKTVYYTRDDLIQSAKNGLYLQDVPEKRYQKKKNREFKTYSIGPLKADGKRWVLTAPLYLPSPEFNPISPLTESSNLFLAGEFVSSPLLNLPTMEHAAESGKLAAQAAVELMGMSYNVPEVEALLHLVNVTTVAEYDEKVKMGIFTGTC